MPRWRQHLPILLYHSVGEYPDDPFAVTRDALLRQLEHLLRQGWEFLETRHAIELLRAGRLRPRTVCVTFDDAYVDFAEHAVPVLGGLGVPATLFVPVGALGGKSWWSSRDPHRPILTERQVEQLPRSLVALGSHTVTHPNLSRSGIEHVERELRESLAQVREMGGRRDVLLAYPYGAFGRRERGAAWRAGYAGACTAESLLGNWRWTDRFSLERLLVSANDTPAVLERRMATSLGNGARAALLRPRALAGRIQLDATSPGLRGA